MNKSFLLKIAGLKIRLFHQYDFTYRHGRGFYDEGNDENFSVSVTEDDLAAVRSQIDASDPYVEDLALFTAIAEKLPEYQRMLFHGAAVTVDDKAIVFTAPSGTGKTTHIRLWRHFLQNKVDIINGDKPVFEFLNDSVVVHSSPWAGKENWKKNRSAVLSGICLLKQAKVNSIRQLSGKDAVSYLVQQIYVPHTEFAAERTLVMLDKLCKSVPVYLLECDMSEVAVRLSFEALTGKEFDKERVIHDN